MTSVNTIAIRFNTPQGMHVSLEVLGSVILKETPLSCPEASIDTGSWKCSVNVLIVFQLPVGVFVDPYELKVGAVSHHGIIHNIV